MNWIDGETVFNEYLSNVLHEDTQVEASSVSLTASAIHELKTAGDLDFGGGEFRLGSRDALEPAKRAPEDDYGWWELSKGTYLLELNENITSRRSFKAILQPHDHLIWNGASHATITLTQEETDSRLFLPLKVPESGLNIKENARVTTLRIWESGAKT